MHIINFQGASIRIISSNFSSCAALGDGSEGGGAIYIDMVSSTTTTSSSNATAATTTTEVKTLQLQDLHLDRNQAAGAGGGLHLLLDSKCSLSLTNCTIHGNKAGAEGAAIYLHYVILEQAPIVEKILQALRLKANSI